MSASLREIQACPATRRRARFKVQSTSSAGTEYTVEVSLTAGQVTCDCPGFRFRGTCHHTEFTEDKCGWVEGGEGAEVQTKEQCSGCICPRCGSSTILIAGASCIEDDSEAALRSRGVRVPPPPRSNR
jgi:hypothetical protein